MFSLKSSTSPMYSYVFKTVEMQDENNSALAFAVEIEETQPKIAFSFYASEASTGNSFAQYKCGMMLMDGKPGVPQNVSLALDYLNAAIENGSSEAKEELAKYAELHDDKGTMLRVSEQIWHTEPVFKIKFVNKDAFNEFKAVLDEKLIDFESKIQFDPTNLLVKIHYFPRFARKIIPLEAINKLTTGNIVTNDDTTGDRGLSYRNPYNPLFEQMTSHYVNEQNLGFATSAKNWKDRCQQTNTHQPRPIYATQISATHADVHHLFDRLTEADLILGEDHDDNHAFLTENLAYFSSRGYDTLFLEGLHYEAQPILDAWFNAEEPCTIHPELAALLGDKMELVKQAKVMGVRVVGIDSEQTYVVMVPDLHDYVKMRMAAMNEMACQIYSQEKKENGSGKSIIYVGADHALKSPGGIPGIATVIPAPVIILRYAPGMPEKNKEPFRILSGSEAFFHDADAFKQYAPGNYLTTVRYPMTGKSNPACDVWIEASPDANWTLDGQKRLLP